MPQVEYNEQSGHVRGYVPWGLYFFTGQTLMEEAYMEGRISSPYYLLWAAARSMRGIGPTAELWVTEGLRQIILAGEADALLDKFNDPSYTLFQFHTTLLKRGREALGLTD